MCQTINVTCPQQHVDPMQSSKEYTGYGHDFGVWICWTLKKADEKRIESEEMWIYRRMLRVSCTEHRTDESILLELNTTRQLLGFVVRRKLSYFGHPIRDGGSSGCELVKCVIQGKVNGKRRRGRPKTLTQ